jgi:hypothetical protein
MRQTVAEWKHVVEDETSNNETRDKGMLEFGCNGRLPFAIVIYQGDEGRTVREYESMGGAVDIMTEMRAILIVDDAPVH